ncbi:MAG: DUF6046 domain-containing protein [Flavobacterium nitrogenifigens]|uniref:DUF6046 domain-containing protein n=1 Tax=Flavobacterium nitrogenifigens TaxID=1617283 RepID=UPI0028085C9D|nr:DUF6046 domain-containing protein [Flavobacterium nitrogenifigens]MDQ8012043.1 DUF6046 domain-containing protein [Flavobacterium nitrogenifigens]
MADQKYNVSKLFQSAFGLNSPVYITETQRKDKPAIFSYKGIETLPEYYKPDAVSWMGTPIMFSAKFLGRSYQRYNANGEIERVEMNDFQLPAATMFSFRRAHNITRTNLLGNNGTVKEIYGFDDWVIDVRGLCLDEPEQSAHEQLEQLLKWEELADGIDISGALFEQRRISRVAIADWSDNLQQGSYGVIPFQFQLFSDEDIILVL